MKNIKDLLRVFKDQRGQANILFAVVIITASVVLVAGLGLITYNEIKKIENVEKSSQSLYVAEAGAEDALLRLKNNMEYSTSYTLDVGEGSASVQMNGPLVNITVTSSGNVDSRVRKVAVNLNATPTGGEASFNYGIQVGNGGLEMASNTAVLGNVFSNGPAIGSSGAEIFGDIFSAGASGIIDNFDVKKSDPSATDGNAHANTVDNSDVENIIYCQTGSGNNKVCDTSQSDPVAIPLPVSDETIDVWKSQAAAGGEITSVTIGGGDTQTLGPVKINGDLTIQSNAVLIILGTIWVTGEIDINSNTRIELHSSYGDDSGTIIADGKIELDSNTTVCGSEGSTGGVCNTSNGTYIMFLSTNNSQNPASPAIDMSSNTSLAILYSSVGVTTINANTDVLEVTAYKLKINANATVSYQTGLANVNFTSGPGGTFTIKSWVEVE